MTFFQNRLFHIIAVTVSLGHWSLTMAEPYRITTVEAPFEGATETELFGINNPGVAVGSYLDGSGVRRGFLWDTAANEFSDFAVSGATGTRVFGIDDAGNFTGYWQEPGFQHGFVNNGGTITSIDRPGFDTNYAWGINNHGQIAGYVFDFSDGFFITSHRYNPDGNFNTVLFSTDGSGTVTRGINDAGVQVGWSLEADGSTIGVIYDGDGFATFSLGATKSTLPNDVNNTGVIVGNVANLDFTRSRGFVRDASGNISFIDVAGAEWTQALGINDLGIVVGHYEDENEVLRSFIATPVPEPSSFVVLGVIAMGIVGPTASQARRCQAR